MNRIDWKTSLILEVQGKKACIGVSMQEVSEFSCFFEITHMNFLYVRLLTKENSNGLTVKANFG
jgi:hypothetical protein